MYLSKNKEINSSLRRTIRRRKPFINSSVEDFTFRVV